MTRTEKFRCESRREFAKVLVEAIRACDPESLGAKAARMMLPAALVSMSVDCGVEPFPMSKRPGVPAAARKAKRKTKTH